MGKSLRIFLTIFAACAFFTNDYLTTNDASRFSMTVALVETRGLEITHILPQVLPPPRGEGWVARDFINLGGRIYSDKAPLGAVLAAPVYFTVTRFTRRLPLVVYFTSLFTAGLLTALAGVIIYRLGRRFGCADLQSMIVALSYGLCSMALFYGSIFFSGGITAFFLIAAFALLTGDAGAGRRTLAGISAALAVSSDYYAGIAAAALLVYSAFPAGEKPHLRDRAAAAVGFAAGLIPLMLYNNYLFGNPFDTGYRHSYLAASLHSKGFYGITAPTVEGAGRMFKALFMRWGLFFANLPLLFSLVYFYNFARFRREAAVVAAMFAGYCFMYMSVGWDDAYSARFFMPALPFLFLPLMTLPLKGRATRNFFFFMSGIAMFLTFVGADHFLPHVKSLARPGMQNLLGAWLAARGYATGYYTFIPLMAVIALIWIIPPRNGGDAQSLRSNI